MIVLVLGVAMPLIGWWWMWRIRNEGAEPDRMAWRRSAVMAQPRSDLRVGLEVLTCVLIAAVAIGGLVALPLEVPRVRLRTIVFALAEGAALVGAITGSGPDRR